MANLAIVFISLILGIVLRRTGWFADGAHVPLNQFVLGVSLPALSLLYLPYMELSLESLGPASTAWVVFLLAWAIFGLLGPRLGFDKATIGCIILCCGLFNSSFIGFPVITALYGEQGMQQALLVDQPGSFLVLSTLGVWVAMWYSSGQYTAATMARKLFTFPPMLAFIAALLLKSINYQHTPLTTDILKSLGHTITPLALVSVGLQLKWEHPVGLGKALTLGLLYKLLLAPVAIFVLLSVVFNLQGLPLKVSVLEAAMAPMITGAILAAQNNLNPKLANMFIGVGIPVAFATLAFWWWLVG